MEHSGLFDCAIASGLNDQKEKGLYQEDYLLFCYLGSIAMMIPSVTRAISVSLVSCSVGHWQSYQLCLLADHLDIRLLVLHEMLLVGNAL